MSIELEKKYYAALQVINRFYSQMEQAGITPEKGSLDPVKDVMGEAEPFVNELKGKPVRVVWVVS